MKDNYIGTTGIKVPDGWNKTTIEHICNVTGGKRLPKGHSFSDKPTDYPYIRVKDINSDGTINTDNLNYLSKTTHLKISNYIAESKDILLSIAGSVGRASIVPKELDGANITENVGRLMDIKENPTYLSYYLNSDIGDSEIIRWTGGGVQDKLALTRIPYIEVPLPPLDEQRRIASVLYSVDEQVRSLHDRHDELTKLKHGLMQDLLTGNKRVTPKLKVHSKVSSNPTEISEKNWSVKKLRDLSRIQAGTSPGKKDESKYWGGSVPWIKIGDMSESHKYIENVEEYLTEDGKSNSRLIPKNSVVVALFGATRGQVKITSIEGCTHEGIACLYDLDSELINSEYLLYILQNEELERFGAGSAQKNLSKSILEKVEISVPPLWEQERIASILYTVDEMIARTSELIDEYDRLKRGLMQDLLSGDVRTPEDLEVLEEINI